MLEAIAIPVSQIECVPSRYIHVNGRKIPVYGRLSESARRCIVQRVAFLAAQGAVGSESPAEGDGTRRDGE